MMATGIESIDLDEDGCPTYASIVCAVAGQQVTVAIKFFTNREQNSPGPVGARVLGQVLRLDPRDTLDALPDVCNRLGREVIAMIG